MISFVGRRWPPLDCPVYYLAPVYGDLGDGQKILNITIARPGATWGGLFYALQPSNVGALVPILPGSFQPLVRHSTSRRRHFCARIQHGKGEAKAQNRRKGHLQALHGASLP